MSSAKTLDSFDTFELAEKAERSLRRAVRQLYEDRARSNDTVSIWRDGKMMILPARDLLAVMDRATSSDKNSQTEGNHEHHNGQ